MPTCLVCQDEMDMEEFEDERDATTTCLKLECGHAFHSRCIISYMRRTDYDCIQCNRHRTPEATLEEAGLCAQAILAFKQDREVRRIRALINRKSREYCKVRTAARKQIETFVKENDGFGVAEKYKEIEVLIKELKTYTKTECMQRNPTLMAAIKKELSPEGISRYTEYSFRRMMGLPSQWDLRTNVMVKFK